MGVAYLNVQFAVLLHYLGACMHYMYMYMYMENHLYMFIGTIHVSGKKERRREKKSQKDRANVYMYICTH